MNAFSLILIALFSSSSVQTVLPPLDTYRAVKRDSKPDSPQFGVRMFNSASDSSHLSRLTVQLTFVNDALQFVKIGKKVFQGNYDVTVTLTDSSSGLERAKQEWSGSVEVDSFDKTNSTNNLVSTIGEVLVQPGDYLATIELRDQETGRSGREEGRVTAMEFADGAIAASDIMFLNSLSFLDEDTNASAEGEAPIVYAYIEIYNVPSDDSVDIAFTVTTIGGSQLMQSEKRIAGSGEKLKEHFRLSSEAQAAGNFEVTIEVKHREERLVRKQRLRQTEPRQAISIEHLDDAIERMIYIATGKEIKAMLALPEGEKLDVFDAFWAKFDPSPGTPDNQYRDEYYRRIALAEREFKSYRPGWKTDRGLVLVKIGQPNYINRPYLREFDPLSRQRSQEIWEYSTLNRRVIFERVHDEYRIVNRIDIFDLLSREGIRL